MVSAYWSVTCRWQWQDGKVNRIYPFFPEEEALSSDELSPELCKLLSSSSEEEELWDELEELDISYLWTFDKNKQCMDTYNNSKYNAKMFDVDIYCQVVMTYLVKDYMWIPTAGTT